ncbi:MAG: Crp/Fnr family transcriptional regulator [Oligoflexia bacterium]|nr:MAG: Crp/Fnr family transcriptional regulator [Oligoflexia bacterium]
MPFVNESNINLSYNSTLGLIGNQQGSQVLFDLPYEVMNLKENEVIFKPGDYVRGLYFLKSGAVKTVVNRELTRGRIHSPEYITKIVGEGEFFGLRTLIKGGSHTSMAKTLRPCEVLLFPREGITNIMNGPRTMLKMVLTQLTKDMDEYEVVNQLHYLASVQERIAYRLVLLAEKFGVPTAGGVSINMKLTRNELAQLAGTINESLSRHLSEMKSEGILELVGKEIIVKNMDALKSKSGNYRA